MDIKNTLIFIRESKGYSKKTVSEMTGIPYTTYIKYESGERKDVSMDAIVKLADFYGVSTDYLLGRPNAKPPTDPVEEFTNRVQLQEQEQIILKKWLTLDEKKRQAVFDFMVDIVHEYESSAMQSIEQSTIKKTTTTIYNSELAIARSNERNYMPPPTEEQYNSFEELTDDMLGE